MGNARTREEIGTVECYQCDGAGAMDCEECGGTGFVLAETPRLAVQRREGGRWETLIRVDGDDFGAAETYRDAYQKERPAQYRIVQEIDEEEGNAPRKAGLPCQPR